MMEKSWNDMCLSLAEAHMTSVAGKPLRWPHPRSKCCWTFNGIKFVMLGRIWESSVPVELAFRRSAGRAHTICHVDEGRVAGTTETLCPHFHHCTAHFRLHVRLSVLWLPAWTTATKLAECQFHLCHYSTRCITGPTWHYNSCFPVIGIFPWKFLCMLHLV